MKIVKVVVSNNFISYRIAKGRWGSLYSSNEQRALTFTFPTVNRRIERVNHVAIEPLWEGHQEHFVGLYRMIIQLTFSDEVNHLEKQEAIAIDVIDVNGQDGYFEYALPFEGIGNVDMITVEKTNWHINNPDLTILWDSRIVLRDEEPLEIVEATPVMAEQAETVEAVEAVVEKEERVEVSQTAPIQREEPVEQEQPSQKATTKPSHIFLNDLVEQYSIWRSSDFGPQQQPNNNE